MVFLFELASRSLLGKAADQTELKKVSICDEGKPARKSNRYPNQILLHPETITSCIVPRCKLPTERTVHAWPTAHSERDFGLDFFDYYR